MRERVCQIDRKEKGEGESVLDRQKGERGEEGGYREIYMKSETQLEILCLSGPIIVFFLIKS